MAWDSSRPVPWQRLMREAAIFLVLGGIIFAVAIKHSTPSSYVGLVVGMFLFVGVSAVLAKFGYSRQSMKELRAAQAARPRSSGRSRAGRSSTPNTAAAVARTKPAPTKRTSTGPSQRPNRKRR